MSTFDISTSFGAARQSPDATVPRGVVILRISAGACKAKSCAAARGNAFFAQTTRRPIRPLPIDRLQCARSPGGDHVERLESPDLPLHGGRRPPASARVR